MTYQDIYISKLVNGNPYRYSNTYIYIEANMHASITLDITSANVIAYFNFKSVTHAQVV